MVQGSWCNGGREAVAVVGAAVIYQTVGGAVDNAVKAVGNGIEFCVNYFEFLVVFGNLFINRFILSW